MVVACCVISFICFSCCCRLMCSLLFGVCRWVLLVVVCCCLLVFGFVADVVCVIDVVVVCCCVLCVAVFCVLLFVAGV